MTDDLDTDALWTGAAQAALWANALLFDGERPNLPAETCIAAADDRSLWTPDAIETINDVVDWAQANASDVREYMEATGRDGAVGVDLLLGAHQLGHDFSLSRAGHGTGLWDRGAGAVGDRLHKAAKVYGAGDLLVELNDDGEVVKIDAM